MSIRSVVVIEPVSKPQLHCDGPNHVYDTYMACEAITVLGGYGSDFDGDTYHFCNVPCLADWANVRREVGR